MKVGLLTGGGDCPGLNAVIRAVVQRDRQRRGLVRRHPRRLARPGPGHDVAPSTSPRPTGSSPGAGRSSARRAPTPSRTPTPTSPRSGPTSRRSASTPSSPSAATTPWASPTASTTTSSMPMVGIPKTIDNDLMVTDFTFGFDTAINIVTEAVDRLRTTTESHRRIMVVETMGRHAGWIACFAGIAVARRLHPRPRGPDRHPPPGRRPQAPPRRGQELRDRHRLRRGRVPRPGRSITLDAEPDAFGHVRLGGIGNAVAEAHRGRRPASRPAASSSATSSAAAPQRLRPRPGHPARPGRRPPRPPAALRHHGRPLGDQDHRDHPRRRRRRQPRPST